jgi:hypothetical protein
VIFVFGDGDSTGLSQERVLGRARLILAGASLAAVYVDPTRPVQYVTAAFAVLVIYVIASLLYLVVLGQMQSLPERLPVITHLIDCISLAALTTITGASSSPLFPFFIFIVLAAAVRWGYRETLATTFALVWVILVETLVLLSRGSLQAGSIFELNLFLVRVTYMSITGVLLAFLASHQKKLQMESTLVARILSRIRSEPTLDAALETTGHELLRSFGAQGVAIAVRETRGNQAMLWTLSAGDEEMQRTPISPAEADGYLAKAPAAFVLRRRRKQGDHHGRAKRQCRRRGDNARADADIQDRARDDGVVRRRLVRAGLPLRSVAANQQR